MQSHKSLFLIRGISALQGLLVLAILLIIGWILIPVNLHNGGGHMSTQCISNVKQLITAALIYRGDHDERLPLRDTWMDALVPYTQNEHLFHCPAIQEANGNNQRLYGYSFNSRFSGTNADKVPNPDREALTYDSINLARNASDPLLSLPDPPRSHREKKGNFIGYLDGHAKRVSGRP